MNQLTLEELLQDIHGLDKQLSTLEQAYGMLSEDMYKLYQLGEWEQSRDLIRWVGYYELRQERQKAYATVLREHLLQMRQGASTRLTLKPLVSAVGTP